MPRRSSGIWANGKSWRGNALRLYITDPLWGEFTCPQNISTFPLQMESRVGLCCVLCWLFGHLEQTVELMWFKTLWPSWVVQTAVDILWYITTFAELWMSPIYCPYRWSYGIFSETEWSEWQRNMFHRPKCWILWCGQNPRAKSYSQMTQSQVQRIPNIMPMSRCCVFVVITSMLLHWNWRKYIMAPVPAKQHWTMWVN